MKLYRLLEVTILAMIPLMGIIVGYVWFVLANELAAYALGGVSMFSLLLSSVLVLPAWKAISPVFNLHLGFALVYAMGGSVTITRTNQQGRI